MKIVLLIASVVLILLGLHWIGQGTGLFPWPANPVMDNHIAWAWYGAVATIIGVALIFYENRKVGTGLSGLW